MCACVCVCGGGGGGGGRKEQPPLDPTLLCDLHSPCYSDEMYQ